MLPATQINWTVFAKINFLGHQAPENDIISFLNGFFPFPRSKNEWYYLNERYRDTHQNQWTAESELVVGKFRIMYALPPHSINWYFVSPQNFYYQMISTFQESDNLQ